MPFIQPTGVSLRPHGNPINAKDTEANNLSVKKQTKSDNVLSFQVKNNWVKSADNSIHIFTKTWHPVGTAAESVVVFIHDIIEHCERYQSLFAYFADKGIEVQSFDLPGFGETGARANALGVTGGYDKLLREIDSAIERASVAYPNKPLFLMGHGMGGALVLNYVCGLGRKITLLAGVISSSPYLKPTMIGAGARFPSTYNRLGKWYPNISISFPITPQELTRDHAEQERYQNDGLVRDSVSLQCLGDMIYQGNKLLNKRWKKFPVQLPILLFHGTDDPICSYQSSAALSNQFLKLQPHNYKFKSWKGHKHDPHWDIDASTVKSEYIQWIRTNSRHFEKAPLEASMVHSDSIKSARAGKSKKELEEQKRRNMEAKQKEKEDKKKLKGDEAKQKQEGLSAAAELAASKQTKEPNAELEQPINDLNDLLRQQQQKLQKAEEKRREYGLTATQENQETPENSQILPVNTSDDNAGLQEPKFKLEGELKSEAMDYSMTEIAKQMDCPKNSDTGQHEGGITSDDSGNNDGTRRNEQEKERVDESEDGKAEKAREEKTGEEHVDGEHVDEEKMDEESRTKDEEEPFVEEKEETENREIEGKTFSESTDNVAVKDSFNNNDQDAVSEELDPQISIVPTAADPCADTSIVLGNDSDDENKEIHETEVEAEMEATPNVDVVHSTEAATRVEDEQPITETAIVLEYQHDTTEAPTKVLSSLDPEESLKL
ncbi:hypothetical protein BGZ46_007077 [Entomortierella lignicola]|nr:hypothetical protein BGZ46_007077 [Entomortierella lignicola]